MFCIMLSTVLFTVWQKCGRTRSMCVAVLLLMSDVNKLKGVYGFSWKPMCYMRLYGVTCQKIMCPALNQSDKLPSQEGWKAELTCQTWVVVYIPRWLTCPQ